MKALHSDKAPKALGPYSQAIVAGGFVFASGQVPIDPATGEFAEGGIKEQTRQSLTNVTNVLAEAGIDLSHVVKTTVFLSDMDNFAAMNEVYATFFKEPFPARSAVAVKTLPKGALVGEVERVGHLLDRDLRRLEEELGFLQERIVYPFISRLPAKLF